MLGGALGVLIFVIVLIVSANLVLVFALVVSGGWVFGWYGQCLGVLTVLFLLSAPQLQKKMLPVKK